MSLCELDMELLMKRMAARGHRLDDAVLIVMGSVIPVDRCEHDIRCTECGWEVPLDVFYKEDTE